MAGNSATLTVKIVSDAKDAAKGFDDASKRTEKFRSGLNKASVAAAGVLGGLGLLAKGAFDAASALQQSTGAIDTVFGDWALDIEQAAQGAATSVGLSTSAYEELASVIGSQLKGAGMDIADVTAHTQDLVSRGADLAATFGGTTQEAVNALGSALKGEFDPMERYGVSIKQSDINARLAAEGNDKLTGAALKTATANAALALITDATTASNGAFARESDTAAGAQARATAQFENAQAALGEQLLPIVAAAAAKFSELTGFLVEHKEVVTLVALVVGGLALAVIGVNAAVSAYFAIVRAATAVQIAWNLVMAANPIMLIVIGLGLVVAAVIYAYNKFDWFKNIVDTVGSVAVTIFNSVVDAVGWVWDKVSGLGDVFSTVFTAIVGFIQPVLDLFSSLWDMAGKVLDKIGGAASWVGDLFSAPAAAGSTTGGGGGMYGAARGAAPAPLRAATLGARSGGTGPSAGPGSGLATVVNITVQGAVDPVSTARQIRRLLDNLDTATGRRLTASMGRA